MFLIEYENGKFINGKNVKYINLNEEEILFTLDGDNESCFKVDEKFAGKFVNNLQALNGNIQSVECKFRELNGAH